MFPLISVSLRAIIHISPVANIVDWLFGSRRHIYILARWNGGVPVIIQLAMTLSMNGAGGRLLVTSENATLDCVHHNPVCIRLV